MIYLWVLGMWNVEWMLSWVIPVDFKHCWLFHRIRIWKLGIEGHKALKFLSCSLLYSNCSYIFWRFRSILEPFPKWGSGKGFRCYWYRFLFCFLWWESSRLDVFLVVNRSHCFSLISVKPWSITHSVNLTLLFSRTRVLRFGNAKKCCCRNSNVSVEGLSVNPRDFLIKTWSL